MIRLLSPQPRNRNFRPSRRRDRRPRGQRPPRRPFCLLPPNRGQAGKCRHRVFQRPTSLRARLSLRLRRRLRRRQAESHRRRPLSFRQSAHQPTKGSRQARASPRPPRRRPAEVRSTQRLFVMSRRCLRSRCRREHRARRPNGRLRHRRSGRAWILGPRHPASRAV